MRISREGKVNGMFIDLTKKLGIEMIFCHLHPSFIFVVFFHMHRSGKCRHGRWKYHKTHWTFIDGIASVIGINF
jgi:hypothetical protein